MAKANKRTLPRGGARNRRDRASHQLTERDCRKVLGAASDAWSAGRPFNRWVTILWERGGIDRMDNAKATGAFIALAREWMRSRGHPLPWAWVQEWGKLNGAHCHILLYVPPELDPLFRPMPRRWVTKVLGGQYVARALRAKRLSLARCASAGVSWVSLEAAEKQVLGKVHYMLKCAPARLEVQLGLEGLSHGAWGQTCLVHGMRAGVWQQQRGCKSRGK